jgi:hypothetical protein
VIDFEAQIRQILWKSAGFPFKDGGMDSQVCGICGSFGHVAVLWLESLLSSKVIEL